MSRHKKGQLFSIDASFSLIVFILILLFLLVVWNLYSARLEKRVQEEEMQLVAMQALDVLTKTWGVPNNWELKSPVNPDPPTNNPQVLGLQLNPGSLDNKKVDALNKYINSTQFARLLNIDRYEYYFRILDSQGQAVMEKGVPPANSTLEKPRVISVSSFMNHQGENSEIVLTLRQ